MTRPMPTAVPSSSAQKEKIEASSARAMASGSRGFQPTAAIRRRYSSTVGRRPRRVILCDRYTDATVAYQGYAGGVDPELIRELNLRATGGVLPDLTLLFDCDPAVGFRRIGRRHRDHFERKALAFHRRVRKGYREIQRAEPKRV